VIASLTSSNVVALLALSLSMIGPLMFLGPFWGMNSMFVSGRVAAGAIALVSSLGSLGGFVGPYIVGVSTEKTGSYIPGIMVLALGLGIAAIAVFVLGRTIRLRGAELARQSS